MRVPIFHEIIQHFFKDRPSTPSEERAHGHLADDTTAAGTGFENPLPGECVRVVLFFANKLFAGKCSQLRCALEMSGSRTSSSNKRSVKKLDEGEECPICEEAILDGIHDAVRREGSYRIFFCWREKNWCALAHKFFLLSRTHFSRLYSFQLVFSTRQTTPSYPYILKWKLAKTPRKVTGTIKPYKIVHIISKFWGGLLLGRGNPCPPPPPPPPPPPICMKPFNRSFQHILSSVPFAVCI